ncbi:MAG: helix-turn-helix domain-containing protein, partial [Verrucomicrobiota bacterium]|nr:helix-turn-helix domain-containing protein [Verrucomicrobiota bacterium]
GDEIPHTRRTLAQLAGTTVESAIRATTRLSEKGIIETRRRQIKIIAPQKLKDAAHSPVVPTQRQGSFNRSMTQIIDQP